MLIPGDKATKFVDFIVELIETVLDERLAGVQSTEDMATAINGVNAMVNAHTARIDGIVKVMHLHKDQIEAHDERLTELEEEATNGHEQQPDVMVQLARMVAEIITTTTKPTTMVDVNTTRTNQPKRSPQQGVEKGGPRVRARPIQYKPKTETEAITWSMIPNDTWVTAGWLASQGHTRGSGPWDYWRRTHSRNLLAAYRQGRLERRIKTNSNGEHEYRKPTTQPKHNN